MESTIEEFEDFLENRVDIASADIGRYAGWVRRCSYFCMKDPHYLNLHDADYFIDNLYEEDSLSPLIISQAKEALMTFIQHFISASRVSSDFSRDARTSFEAWACAGDKLSQALYKRRFPERIAGTYTHWVKCFAKSAEYTSPDQLQPKDAVRFLKNLNTDSIDASEKEQAWEALLFFFRYVLKQDSQLLERFQFQSNSSIESARQEEGIQILGHNTRVWVSGS